MTDFDDVSVMINKRRFNFRVAALVEFENKILLHKPLVDTFWNLAGGRVKCGENTKLALVREMKEELDVTIKEEDLRLVQLSENFFEYHGQSAHEILFVYAIKLDATNDLLKSEVFFGKENKTTTFRWFDREDVKNHTCLPLLIYDLAKDSSKFCHSIVDEIKHS